MDMERPQGSPGWFPGWIWLSAYRRGWLAADLMAGMTLAAYALPVSLAYASLAGVPPQFGVYCYWAAGPVYACLGTSRQLALGPTAAISMVVGSTIAPLAQGDAQRWAAIAAMTALLVAVLALAAWMARLSGLVSFISETILSGFKAGAALTIGMTQLPKLFGVPGGGDSFLERASILLSQLDQTRGEVLLLGLLALALLGTLGRFCPQHPGALYVVGLAIVVSTALGLADQGVPTVGVLPAGLPSLEWPSVRARDIEGVVPLAAACFLLSYVEGVSAARAMAAERGGKIDARQELLALAGANLAVGLFHGFPVAGGLSQSAVNAQAGARTPLALVVCSSAIAICLVFLSGALRNLPTVILAAVVLMAVTGLFNLPALVRLYRVSRFEFTVALVALVGVLLLGILKGVVLAVVASLLIVIGAVARPHVALLGRLPGSGRMADRERHPDAAVVAGVVALRVEGSLLYFNAEHVGETIASLARGDGPTRFVVIDLSNSPLVDVAGAKLLEGLQREFAAQQTRLVLAGVHGRNRDLLLRAGLPRPEGELEWGSSVEQVLAELNSAETSPV